MMQYHIYLFYLDKVITCGCRSRDGAEKKQEVASLPSGVQGLGIGLPDLRSKKDKRKQKAPKDNSNHAAETLDKLRQQTREAVKGLDSLAGGNDLGNNEMMEDWVKQFEELTGSQVIFLFNYIFILSLGTIIIPLKLRTGYLTSSLYGRT